MPVNTAALKTFAPAMRRQLLEAVGRKLDLLLNSQTPDTLSTYTKQIAELREQEADNREQLIERVAYTWFNRLCALRYLDAKGWHPFGCKVLMPAAEGETQPELLKLMRAGSLPAELKSHTNEVRLHGLLDGQIPSAIGGADPQGEVYRELVLASCRSYHQLLPELFEGLDDASELLLPDDLLSEGSIAGGFRSAISDEDCEDVEIIGWLYQFYISEKKDQVIGKVVKSEDIPAATQLFTPNWIVKYMVQNSLGATWLATYPDSPLKGTMEFYIEPAEQTPEVQAQLAPITPESLDPEALTLIDPACGSGHILVEAYDLLKAIYLERGYRQRDIPELILTKNLYGLDICPRAAQLTAFSLLMKGREDDRRLLERGIQLNVMALHDSTGLSVERLAASMDLTAVGVSRADLRMLADLFIRATTFGSLIQVPTVLVEKLSALTHLANQATQDLFTADDHQRLRELVRQAKFLAYRYDAVVANPPYMGSGGMNTLVKKFAQDAYPEAKSDLFACFIERSYTLAKSSGHMAMVTMQNWMFLTSFEKMRRRLIAEKSLSSMAHIGYNSFPSMNSKVAQAAAFSLLNTPIPGLQARFVNLNRAPQSANKEKVFLSWDSENLYTCSLGKLNAIPGSPIAYWPSERVREIFATCSSLADLARPRQGMASTNDDLFLRRWHEVQFQDSSFCARSCKEAADSQKKWFPFLKGGDFRRWYGNNEFVVNFKNDGQEVCNYIDSTPGARVASSGRIINRSSYFRPIVTWTLISSANTAFRLCESGFILGHKGPGISADMDTLNILLPFLNSCVTSSLLDILAPTLGFEVGQIAKLPVLQVDTSASPIVEIAAKDWDSY